MNPQKNSRAVRPGASSCQILEFPRVVNVRRRKYSKPRGHTTVDINDGCLCHARGYCVVCRAYADHAEATHRLRSILRGVSP